MNVEAAETVKSVDLTAADFLVTADEFVRRCAKAVGLNDLSPVEVHLLSDAIQKGKHRLDIVDILISKVDPEDPRLARPNPKFVMREVDSFIIADLLEKYAPDDDREFARFAIDRILGGNATDEQLDAAQGELWLKPDRRAFLEGLAARRMSRGQRAEISARAAAGDIDGIHRLGGATVQPAGQKHIVVVRHEPGIGWTAAANVQVSVADVDKAGWKTHEGWVVAGPKQPFAPGLWRLDVHIVQPEDAVIVLDVVANAGIDILAKATLLGPARFSVRVDIRDWHHFIELRLFKPRQPEAAHRLDIRNLSFTRLS
jgi:hypothetical protein